MDLRIDDDGKVWRDGMDAACLCCGSPDTESAVVAAGRSWLCGWCGGERVAWWHDHDEPFAWTEVDPRRIRAEWGREGLEAVTEDLREEGERE